MFPVISPRAALTLGCSVLLCFISACSSGSGAYLPFGQEARQALEAGLNAWQNGKRPGLIEATSPAVQVVDTGWQGGLKLDRFTILNEETQDGVKRFTVRLSLKEPRVERDVLYVVIGREPVWVYRDEDFQRMLRMDNNPSQVRKTSRLR